MDAPDVIDLLQLRPHPEGGWYAETWRDDRTTPDGRPLGSAIYFLLEPGQRSHWHRVDAAETWHHYDGGPIRLRIDDRVVVLGHDLAAGHRPQAVVPADAWQSAEPIDGWALVGCTVAPAFTFERFELAPPGWEYPGDTARA